MKMDGSEPVNLKDRKSKKGKGVTNNDGEDVSTYKRILKKNLILEFINLLKVALTFNELDSLRIL